MGAWIIVEEVEFQYGDGRRSLGSGCHLPEAVEGGHTGKVLAKDTVALRSQPCPAPPHPALSQSPEHRKSRGGGCFPVLPSTCLLEGSGLALSDEQGQKKLMD